MPILLLVFLLLDGQTCMEVTTCLIPLCSPTAPLIPAGFASLICDAQAWELIPVYFPLLPDTASGGRDFLRVATL